MDDERFSTETSAVQIQRKEGCTDIRRNTMDMSFEQKKKKNKRKAKKIDNKEQKRE